MQPNSPLHSASFYRAQARKALAGRWVNALIWLAVLTLITGMMFGLGFSLSSVENANNPSVYTMLQAQIGPFFSVSFWQNGKMVLDSAESTTRPGLIAFSPAFLAAAAVLTLVFSLLIPVYFMGQVRLSSRIVQGEALNASLLRLSARTYFRFIGASVLIGLRTVWLPLLVMLGGFLLAFLLPQQADFVIVATVIAFLVLFIMRMLYYTLYTHVMVLKSEWTVKELLKQCRALMTGRRAQLFKLIISFIGWTVLSIAASNLLQFGIRLINSSLLGITLSDIVSAIALLPCTLYTYTTMHIFAKDLLRRAQTIPEKTETPDAEYNN